MPKAKTISHKEGGGGKGAVSIEVAQRGTRGREPVLREKTARLKKSLLRPPYLKQNKRRGEEGVGSGGGERREGSGRLLGAMKGD